MATNDGGSAFPHPGYHGIDGKFVDVPHVGMTLRDWFAGQALGGMLSAESQYLSFRGNWTDASQQAYEIADAMLAERNKGGQGV